MNTIYSTVGISKQSFHQWLNRSMVVMEEQQNLLPILSQLRQDHPVMSCRQMYLMLKPETMGRDKFEEFCHSYGYKVEPKKARYKTTDSRGIIYFPNLLLTLVELSGINQLWVSDITYFETSNQVYYLTFITDIYNREIVGYSVSKSLRTEHTTLPALRMAISKTNLKKESGLIFHSDGGGQYYCKIFVALTKSFGIRNSMGKTAYQNPHAERINGTIKNNYLVHYQPSNYNELKKMLIKAVNMYNLHKPHQSLNGYTPQAFKEHVNNGLLTKTWIINKKKKVTKKEKVNIFIN
ncbi:MAG: IS3 family transposase [Saprospiraceae bacterium]|nr:IS3 family transposase [Saprospiraceae bacterium]